MYSTVTHRARWLSVPVSGDARPYWPRWTSDEANFAVVLAVLADMIIRESVSACSLHTVAHASSLVFGAMRGRWCDDSLQTDVKGTQN